MVENKPTVVRVLVNHGLGGWGGNTVPNVTGRIRMYRGGWSGWIDAAPANTRPMVATPGTSITVVASPSFNTTTDTLNFMLPVSWASGTASYQVEVRVNGYGAVGGFAGHNQVVTRNVGAITYQRRRTLQFRYVRVNWNGAGAPTAAQCVDTLRGAVPLLPTPTAGIAPVPGVGVENRTSGTSNAQIAAERRDMLDDFDDEHNCSFWEEITEWLGSDCPDEDGTIWVLIPGNFRAGRGLRHPEQRLLHATEQRAVRRPRTGALPEPDTRPPRASRHHAADRRRRRVGVAERGETRRRPLRHRRDRRRRRRRQPAGLVACWRRGRRCDDVLGNAERHLADARTMGSSVERDRRVSDATRR